MNCLYDEIIKVNQYIHENKKRFNSEVGELLKEVREKNGICLNEFSSRTLMNPNQIIQIENGKNGITLNKFVIICNSLGENPNHLLEQFLFYSKLDDDVLYYEMQNGKNISKNIFNYIIEKNNVE